MSIITQSTAHFKDETFTLNMFRKNQWSIYSCAVGGGGDAYFGNFTKTLSTKPRRSHRM